MKLDAKTVEAIKGNGTRQEIPDDLCTGLYLFVQPSGSKYWVARYRWNGKRTKRPLGGADVVSLSAAREKVKAIKLDIAEKRDPDAADKVREESSELSEKRLVRTLWTDFAARGFRKGKATAETRTKWNAFYTNHLKDWHDRDAAKVTKRDCLDVVDAAYLRGPNAGNFAVTVLRSFFNWISGRGLIDASPMKGVAKPAPESDNERERTLTDAELAAIWSGCKRMQNAFGPMFQLLAATGQRRTEVSNALWSEFNLDARVWTIPGRRADGTGTKNKKSHKVYLNDFAMGILRSIPKIEGARYVFSTTGETPVSGFSKAKAQLDTLTPGVAHWTLHDFRRTVATSMQRLRVDGDVIEAVENRTRAGAGKRYQRHDYDGEKRAALIRWNGLLARIVANDPAAVAAYVAQFMPPEIAEPLQVVGLRA